MIQTDSLLRERIAEIRQFRTFVDRLELMQRSEIKSIFGDVSIHNKNRRILYSQFVLMHYSLVEGIITQAVTEWLNDALHSKPKVKDLSEAFLNYVVRCKVKKLRDQDFAQWIPQIATLLVDCADEIILSVTEKEARSMWPGNLDARKIRSEILERFGIQFNHRISRSGSEISDLKDQRNDLTHGIKSWEDVGQEYSWPELRKVSNRVILYLCRVIREMRTKSDEQFWLRQTG